MHSRFCSMDMMYVAAFLRLRSLMEEGESMKGLNGL